MNKKIVTTYTFNAAAQTVASPEFVDISKIALITNITDGEVIYDPLEPTLGGTLSNGVLTLEFNTTAMSNTDILQIVLHTGTELERIGFTKAISNGVDTDFFTLRQTGAGMTVNQTGGELVITSGTTARAETIIRSNRAFTGGIRARISSRISQRIVNQQFIYELIDVIGDGLAYTINSATSITVTFPASYGLSTQDVGRSVTLQQFSGTGTFLSGRYAIASVSGNDATITVSGFAVGTGTVSVVGMNFYRLLYDGTTATSASFDVARGGYAWSQKPGAGNVAAYTSATSAAPGHQVVITANDGIAFVHDTLTANSTLSSLLERAKRVTSIPDDIRLFLQIRVLNLGTAPASTTTWNIEQVSVAYYEPTSVAIQDVRPTNFDAPLYVKQSGLGTVQGVTQSGVWNIGTVTSATVLNAIPTPVVDVASAAIATTTTTAAFTPTAGNGYQVVIPVTAVSGTTPTLSVRIEESDDGGTNWYTRFTFNTITATGIYRSPILRLRGNRVRYVQTITGTTPSFTRAINRNQRQDTTYSGWQGKLISAATTNATSILAAPCEVLSLDASNTGTSVRWLKVYDLATAPTVGTSVPVATRMIPPSNGGSNLPISIPTSFQFGFAIAITGGVGDADTTAVNANEVVINYTIG